MSSKYEMYDSAFLGILQNEGEIAKFLDAIFSFLYRRTDFYLLMKSPSDRMGFVPGMAQKLVMSAFKRYEAMAAENESRKKQQVKETSNKCELAATETVPPVGHVEEVGTSSSASQSADTSVKTCKTEELVSSELQSSVAVAVPGGNTEQEKPSVEGAENLSPAECSLLESSSDVASGVNTSVTADDSKSTAKDSSSSLSEQKGTEENDDPELTQQQKLFQANPDSYNGAVRDNYSWSQSITDVDIHVKVPTHVHRGAEVSVEIAKKRLKVAYKNTDGRMVDVLNGELTWEIHKDESMWSLVPGEHVHVNLEKVQERWWDAVLTDEPKISVRKIDPSRPITDLDDEAQAKVEEMMYNEQQKRLGLPQSHEQKVQDMLRQAWDAEGSPFRGQPFDPSLVNISSGNMP